MHSDRRARPGWLACLGPPACLLFLTGSAPQMNAQCLSYYETKLALNVSSGVGRQDSNDVVTLGQSWVTGDTYGVWEPYVTDWAQLNYSAITTGATGNNAPNNTAKSQWTVTLQSYGPGGYSGEAEGWAEETDCSNSMSPLSVNSGQWYIQRPAIVGPNNQPAVSAFWYLGGISADQGYYAQAAWVAQPNGATGTPNWQWSYSGTGGIYFGCTACNSVVVTSASPSANCKADIAVNLNYGGFTSNPMLVTIVAPSTLALQSQYPKDAANGPGYATYYQWTLTDTCGNQDPGLDQNETFGSWTDDYFASTQIHNNWPWPPSPVARNEPDATCYDTLSAYGYTTPAPENPQSPLSSVAVEHDYPWTYFVGSLSFGAGIAVHADTQQWYQDHGRHN